MKTSLRKVLAIVICAVMCMSAITLFAGAEPAAPATPTFAKTVYLSSTGDDANDGLTKATAVKTLEKASEKLETLGGEIIVLDDMTIENPDKTQAYLLYFAQNYSTVYLHGEKKADNTYPRLKFVMNKKVLRWEMSSPFAIYDIELETDLGAAFVFSGNSYPLTIGENVTCVNAGTTAEATAGTHSKFMLFGGQFNASTSAPVSTQTTPVLSVMSGTWAEVWADGNAKADAKDPVLNFLGGIGHEVKPVHTDKGTNGTVTANIWGGTITRLAGFESQGITHVLNLYNGVESNITTMANAYAEGGAATVNKLTGTAPTFFELAECKLTPPAPPVFDDDTAADDGEETTATPTKPSTDTKAPGTTTKAPETTAPDPDKEKKGCSSFVGGMGILAVAAVVGTAVAVCTKKKAQ